MALERLSQEKLKFTKLFFFILQLGRKEEEGKKSRWGLLLSKESETMPLESIIRELYVDCGRHCRTVLDSDSKSFDCLPARGASLVRTLSVQPASTHANWRTAARVCPHLEWALPMMHLLIALQPLRTPATHLLLCPPPLSFPCLPAPHATRVRSPALLTSHRPSPAARSSVSSLRRP